MIPEKAMNEIVYRWFEGYHGTQSTKIETAAARAIAFLGSMRNSDGLWHDFTMQGGSDEWVTAVVGSVLARSGNEEASEWSRNAWDQFGLRNLFIGHGGWSYNARCPEDADSTAWGIRFANNLGLMEAGRTTLAVNALMKHITAEGGMTTYIHNDEIRKYIGIPTANLSGWKMPHTCNTAAAAVLPQMNRLLCPYLAARQLPAGNWDAYWFTDTVYSTAFAMEALLMNDADQFRQAIALAARWILNKAGNKRFIPNRFLPEGSPFATALGLKGLILAGYEKKAREKAVEFLEWLLENQRADGSWEPSFFLLKIPPGHTGSFRDESPDEFPERWAGRVYPDIRSVMTTAFVLNTLLTMDNDRQYEKQNHSNYW